MAQSFPNTSDFTGYDAPSRVECEITDLEIIGDLPADLNGTWYRCGPDPQYPPFLGDDIYINGDGMMSMFRLEAGHVDFKMRYVRTERFIAERAARRSLYGRYRIPIRMIHRSKAKVVARRIPRRFGMAVACSR